MHPSNSLRAFALFGALSLVCAASAHPLPAQARRTTPARRDTLSAAERAVAREATRDARSIARRQLSPDSVVRRLRADSASATAFSDPEARLILLRAREARVRQDSALRAYKATATQRISMGMGAKRLGLEKLLFRGDNVAEISWRRDVGVRVRPIGSRVTVPMASSASGDFSSAISIPYFPGRESLWFPSSNFGVVKSDIDERDVIHPLANGAETYYKYASGDSVDITLDGGRVIKLRELRITARRPEWRLFVGSFWFDRDGGQLVRAAYRLAVDIDIWDVASEESVADAKVSREADRLRDSIARARMPRDLYVKDSILRAPRMQARASDNTNDEDVPLWVKATFRPAKAKLDAITVEYGLYQGKFWLPRANSATASMQMGFVRTPFSIDEKFTYEEVNGDFSLAAIPAARLRGAAGDSSARDSTVVTGGGGDLTVHVSMGGAGSATRSATRSAVDTMKMSTSARSRYRLCLKDSTYTRVESRYEGALRVAYDMPCDASKLANSPALPPAVASDEELFDLKSRDELLAALDFSLQPGFLPQMPKIHVGSDLLRFNRVEGFSAGVSVSQVLGAGYTLNAVGRIGHADRHANGEVSLARSNGARTVTGTVYHRLAATNPEWGGGLNFGASLPAFIYGRDEGFYYRTMGAEFGERRERRRGAIEYKLFIERQWTAGDTLVVNTFSLAKLIADRRFRRNIESEQLSVTGVSGMYSRVWLERPKGLRLTTVLNGEAGTGTFQYARASVEGTAARAVGRFSTALTGAIGSSIGDVPRQRGWFVGGVRTVRGQIAGTQDGDAFWLTRAEVGTKQGVVRPVGFFDIGWAGSRETFGKVQPQRGAGVGVGLLDGLIRVDFSRGLYPLKQWRTDFYLSAAL